MSMDIKRLESVETVPGFHDGIYSRNPRAWDIIGAQVEVELKKLGSSQCDTLREVKNHIGEDALRERMKQQLAVQYDSNPRLLMLWEHEQRNVASAVSRSNGMALG
jgi:hypothetical protein